MQWQSESVAGVNLSILKSSHSLNIQIDRWKIIILHKKPQIKVPNFWYHSLIIFCANTNFPSWMSSTVHITPIFLFYFWVKDPSFDMVGFESILPWVNIKLGLLKFHPQPHTHRIGTQDEIHMYLLYIHKILRLHIIHTWPKFKMFPTDKNSITFCTYF